MSNTDWGIFATTRDNQGGPVFIERPCVEAESGHESVDARPVSFLSLIGRIAFGVGILAFFWTMSSIA